MCAGFGIYIIIVIILATALTACFFSRKKCAKMSVFYVKAVKIRYRLGSMPPDPLIASGGLRLHLQTYLCAPLPLSNSGCATGVLSDNCVVKILPVFEKKLKFYHNLAISLRLKQKFHKIYVFIDMRGICCIAAINK